MNFSWQRWLLSADDPDDLVVEVDVLLDEDGCVLPHLRLMANFVSVRSGLDAAAIISPDGAVHFVEANALPPMTCTVWLHGACFSAQSIICQFGERVLGMTPLSWEIIA